MNPTGRAPRVKGPPENPVTGHLAFHVGFGLGPSGLLAGLDLHPASTLCVSPSSVAMLPVAPPVQGKVFGDEGLEHGLFREKHGRGHTWLGFSYSFLGLTK